MIPNSQTNRLYLSSRLAEWYPTFYQNFKSALDAQGIQPQFLTETKDVWCVDFMPIQVSENRFVRFRFDPSYLKAKRHHQYRSDPAAICETIGLQPLISEIVLDGGNVVKWENKVIMTSRVFEDNPNYSENQLTEKIMELLDLDELIIIPTQPYDLTGHSDGIVRFLDEHTVLINDYSDETDRAFVSELHDTLRKAQLDLVEVPTSMYQNKSTDDATGDYINYLQMEGVIFLPTFKRPEDDQVFKQFESLFPNTTIVPVESNELSRDGGVLNCVSWNVLALGSEWGETV
jgi:agmatine deiminase